MDFNEGCLSSEQKSLCLQLLSSKTNFMPYPHDRKIRLALSQALSVPLNLTVQHGSCAIRCEGGDLNSCQTFKQDHYWADVSSPFYIENCTPYHNYCVTASIGDCCPICTETVFMEDYQREYYNEERKQWIAHSEIFIVLILIPLILIIMALLRNYFNNGTKSTWQRSQSIINDSSFQHMLAKECNKPKIKVVCLYIRENNIIFLDLVNSLQEFLRSVGISVTDIYNEEEEINQSVVKWVQKVNNEGNTKILLFDTFNTHQLWNGTMNRNKILKPLEHAICFTRSRIDITNVHKQLFVIRFQGIYFDTKRLIDLSDGRFYVYPIHRERLVCDLKS